MCIFKRVFQIGNLEQGKEKEKKNSQERKKTKIERKKGKKEGSDTR